MTIDRDLSTKISNMGLLCAVLVVLIHSSVCGSIRSFSDIIPFMFGAQGIPRIAVPYYFLVAGYFLAGRIGEPIWYQRSVAKRV